MLRPVSERVSYADACETVKLECSPNARRVMGDVAKSVEEGRPDAESVLKAAEGRCDDCCLPILLWK